MALLIGGGEASDALVTYNFEHEICCNYYCFAEFKISRGRVFFSLKIHGMWYTQSNLEEPMNFLLKMYSWTNQLLGYSDYLILLFVR